MERIIRIVGIVNKCNTLEMIEGEDYISLKHKGNYFPLETIINDSEYSKAKKVISQIICNLKDKTISYDKENIKIIFNKAMQN